jgi:hypothetical protein
LNDTLNWQYPKSEALPQNGTYIIGEDSNQKSLARWCFASSHLFSIPFCMLIVISFATHYSPTFVAADDFPRLIHHLGPRYSGNFQDTLLIKFLTYEASTSLSMFLSAIATKGSTPSDMSSLMKAVREGLGVNDASLIFSISPASYHAQESNVLPSSPITPRTPFTGSPSRAAQTRTRTPFKIQGDVFLVRARCIDMALWNIGGAAVPLRLVQLACVSYDSSVYQNST